MTARRGDWKVARLWEIPDASEAPGFSRDEYRQAMAERAPHILERWADAGARFEHGHRKTHDVRGFLGVGSFGANAFEAAEGERLVVALDELGDGTGPDGVPLQVHTMSDDGWGDVEVAQQLGTSVPGAELFLYPGDRHLFTDPGSADHDADAAARVTQRVLVAVVPLHLVA